MQARTAHYKLLKVVSIIALTEQAQGLVLPRFGVDKFMDNEGAILEGFER